MGVGGGLGCVQTDLVNGFNCTCEGYAPPYCQTGIAPPLLLPLLFADLYIYAPPSHALPLCSLCSALQTLMSALRITAAAIRSSPPAPILPAHTNARRKPSPPPPSLILLCTALQALTNACFLCSLCTTTHSVHSYIVPGSLVALGPVQSTTPLILGSLSGQLIEFYANTFGSSAATAVGRVGPASEPGRFTCSNLTALAPINPLVSDTTTPFIHVHSCQSTSSDVVSNQTTLRLCFCLFLCTEPAIPLFGGAGRGH